MWMQTGPDFRVFNIFFFSPTNPICIYQLSSKTRVAYVLWILHNSDTFHYTFCFTILFCARTIIKWIKYGNVSLCMNTWKCIKRCVYFVYLHICFISNKIYAFECKFLKCWIAKLLNIFQLICVEMDRSMHVFVIKCTHQMHLNIFAFVWK